MPGTRRGGECRLVAQMLLCFKKLPKITMVMCVKSSFWNHFLDGQHFPEFGLGEINQTKGLFNPCLRLALKLALLPLRWRIHQSVLVSFLYGKVMGIKISEMLTSRYQPVYMAVCIGLATFIFLQLVNLH